MRNLAQITAGAVLAMLLTASVSAQQASRDNASHDAEAPAAKAPRNSEDEKAAAAREADRATGKTRTTPKTASADAENPGVGESSGESNQVGAKVTEKPKSKK